MPRISELPAAASLTTADTLPVVQGGVTKGATLDKMPFVQAGTGALSRTLQGKSRDVVSLTDFAVGDGSTNVGNSLRNALNSFSVLGGKLTVPIGTYVTDAGSGSALSITKPLRIKGDGGVYTAINPSLATSSDDTIQLNPTTSVDNTFMAIEGISLMDPNNGNRTGRYGIFANTQNAGVNLPKMTLRDTIIGQGTSAGFYHLNTPANNVNGGMFGALLQNNEIKGGIKLENTGDSNSIVHNILTGTGWGVNAALVSGASCLEIQSNNITTTYGAIKILSGSRFRILGNNIEHSAAGAAANNDSAVIDITGSSGTMYGGVIKENLVSAFGSTDATTLIKIDNARGTLIQDNVFLSGAAGVVNGISIGSGCQDIRVGANTFDAGVTNKVVDNGTGTMGIVKALTLAAGWTDYDANSGARFIKSTDGMVHLYGTIKGGTMTDGTTIGTLPTGFRPSDTIRLPLHCSSGTAPTTAMLIIAATGVIQISFVTANGFAFFNGTFPASNIANATSLE